MKTIFFDLGGTLLDSDNIFEYIAGQWNIENKKEIQDSLFSHFLKIKENSLNFKTVTQLLSEAVKEVSQEYNLLDISSEVRNFYKEIYLNRVYLFKDSLETLNFLKKKGYRLIVVSDADSEIVYPQLEKLGIKHFFTDFIISSDIKAYKPDTLVVNEAKKYCSTNEEESFFIGDSMVDIDTGKELGVTPIILSNIKYDNLLSYSSLSEFIKNQF